MDGDGASDDARERVLERICAQRASITVAFVLSGMILAASLFLLVFVDLPTGSRVITVANVGITGTVVLAAGLVLRACNRHRRGENRGGE